jgi:hypothetical protein
MGQANGLPIEVAAHRGAWVRQSNSFLVSLAHRCHLAPTAANSEAMIGIGTPSNWTCPTKTAGPADQSAKRRPALPDQHFFYGLVGVVVFYSYGYRVFAGG